jgi:hypothetical protein
MAEAEFLAPPMQYIDYDAQRQQCRATRLHRLAALDDMRMAQLASEQPKLVQAQLALEAAWKNKKADAAGSSNAEPSLPPPVPVCIDDPTATHRSTSTSRTCRKKTK